MTDIWEYLIIYSKRHNESYRNCSNPGIATIDESGMLSALNAGIITVMVSNDTACTPFPVIGIVAGFVAAAFFLGRRH